jgi:hypothetical protein
LLSQKLATEYPELVVPLMDRWIKDGERYSFV